MTTYPTLEAARQTIKAGVLAIIEIDHATDGRCYIQAKAGMAVLGKALQAKPMPAIVRLIAEHELKSAEQVESEQAAFAAAVPGLDELRAACETFAEYNRDHSRFIARDGLGRRPVKPETDLDALRASYPRASLYLVAEAYSEASNDRKAAAGRKAMEILRAGGSLEDAQAVLDNWLPENAWHN